MTRLPRPDAINVRPVDLAYKSAPAAIAARPGTRAPATACVDPDSGEVTALAAVTGVVDEVNDIIVPGALAASLRRRTPRLCAAHDWGRIAGRVVEAKELMPGDPRLPGNAPDGTPWPREAGALWFRARFLPTQEGKEARAIAQAFGPETAYSIGYKVADGGARIRGGRRHITDLDVFEISSVLHGANRLATQLDVKSAAAAGRGVMAARPLLSTGRCMMCSGPAPGSVGDSPGAGLVCPACYWELQDLAARGETAELPLFDALDDDRRGLAEPVTCGVCGQVAGGTVGPRVADRELICADCVAAVDGIGERRTAEVDTGPTSREEYAAALRAERPMTMLSDGTVVYDRAAEGYGWTPGAGGRARP